MRKIAHTISPFISCLFLIAFLAGCDKFDEEVNPVIPISGESIAPGSPLIVKLLTDEQVSGQAEVNIIASPSMGKLTLFKEGLVLYYPNSDFSRGLDSFVYSISSGGDVNSKDTVNVIVDDQMRTQCVPTAVVDSLKTFENQPVAGFIFDNDEFCGEPMRVFGVYDPLNGDVYLSSDSTRYFPKEGFTGHDQFLYYFEDKDENHVYGYVNIEVLPDSANSGCTVLANTDYYKRTVKSQMEVYVLLNDNYCHPYELSVKQEPAYGTAYFDSSGHLIYEPYDTATFTHDELTYNLKVGNVTDTARVIIEAY
ncbi:MAG: Ig-like domain-containing protein [Cyclobacteriaceae bacterium]